MDQRVRVRAAHRRPRRPARPSRPYHADEWRQLQAQSEQAPLTPFQLGHADGSSQPSLMPDEKLISSVGFLPTSLMYFCSGEPMHFCSGVDTVRDRISSVSEKSASLTSFRSLSPHSHSSTERSSSWPTSPRL